MINRIECLQQSLNFGDAAIITNPSNLFYFNRLDSTCGTLIITRNRAIFIIDSRYIEIARREIKGVTVLLQDRLYDQIREFLQKENIQRVFFENDYLTLRSFQKMSPAVSQCELDTTDFLSSSIQTLRSVKDSEEIQLIKQAQSITDYAFSKILEFITPGKTEIQIANQLEMLMKDQGANQLAFDIIVASGPNSSLPHAVPTTRELIPGDFVTMDFGAKYKGYCSDMTRTVGIGKLSSDKVECYKTCLEAQRMGINAAGIGVPCKTVDQTVRKFLDECYPNCFGHSLGHSVGIDIHEGPCFSPFEDINSLCQNGYVITVEPGIYLEGQFGVRIEDIIVFYKNTKLDITCSSKELILL